MSVILNVAGTMAKAVSSEPLTAGLTGEKLNVRFDSAWDGLGKRIICVAGTVVKMVILDASGAGMIPHECMIAGERLRIGADGLNADGSVRIPTVWADCGLVSSSVSEVSDADPEADPTPSEIQQLIALASRAADAAENVVTRADAGEFTGEQGPQGDAGGYYTPSIKKGVLSWTASDPDMPSVGDTDLGTGSAALVLGDTLYYDADGKLSVKVAEAVDEDNTLPVTSAAVAVEIGNIDTLLKTI